MSVDICCTRSTSAGNPAHVAIYMLLSIDGTGRWTDGRTPDCYIDPTSRSMRAASIHGDSVVSASLPVLQMVLKVIYQLFNMHISLTNVSRKIYVVPNTFKIPLNRPTH